MDNFELFNEKQREVLNRYGRRCVICRAVAATLHEEPPKSLNPNWEDEPETWYPLCALHHEVIHSLSRAKAEQWLIKMATRLGIGGTQ